MVNRNSPYLHTSWLGMQPKQSFSCIYHKELICMRYIKLALQKAFTGCARRFTLLAPNKEKIFKDWIQRTSLVTVRQEDLNLPDSKGILKTLNVPRKCWPPVFACPKQLPDAGSPCFCSDVMDPEAGQLEDSPL